MDQQARVQIAAALGRVVSGCFVLTVRHDGQTSGMLTSWVQQAGFEPPALTVCVKKGRWIESLIDSSEHFVLNVIGEESRPWFKHFARGFEPHEDAFAGLAHELCPAGVRLAGCPAYLECRTVRKYDVGDHWLYVAQVIGGRAEPESQPYVHIRKSGFNY